MEIMKSFPPVNCQYGAPMGRRNSLPPADQKVRLRLTRARLCEGVYDQGGANWGATPRTSIYCGWNQSGVRIYVRAADSASASALILEDCAEGSTCGGWGMIAGVAVAVSGYPAQHAAYCAALAGLYPRHLKKPTQNQ